MCTSRPVSSYESLVRGSESRAAKADSASNNGNYYTGRKIQNEIAIAETVLAITATKDKVWYNEKDYSKDKQ